jgi:tryptophan synthase alpha chain
MSPDSGQSHANRATSLSPPARLRRAFALARELGTTFLVPVLPAAWPGVDASVNLIHANTEPAMGCRVGLIVLAFPELDPATAGPVADTLKRARGQLHPEAVFEVAAAYQADGGRVPLVALASGTVVDRFGADRFAARCLDAGFAATLLPDLQDELHTDNYAALATADLPPAIFTGLTGEGLSANERLLGLAGDAFVCGVRTADREDAMALPEMAASARSAQAAYSGGLRLVIGGGVSTRGHVAVLASTAQGIIVGRCLTMAMTDARSGGATEDAAALELLAELAAGIAPHDAGADAAIFEPELTP